MIISRYFAKEVYATVLATSVVLLLIFMSNQFVHYLQYAVSGRIAARTVILILALKMPVLLGLLLPLSLYLGILMVYGRMYADSEMTVLFASGVSYAHIFEITLKLSLLVAGIVALLVFWISPMVNRYADNLLVNGGLSPLELVQSGRFVSVDSGKWVFYVADTSRDHKKFYNIFAAERPEKATPGKGLAIMSAESGKQKIDSKTGDTFLIFHNGNRYMGTPGQRDYQIGHFREYGLRVDRGKTVESTKQDAVATGKLLQNLANPFADAELHWRIAAPLMTLILALLALPLSYVRSRQARYIQLVPAILVYIMYGNFIFLGRSWIRSGVLSSAVGMWWAHAIMLALALILICRQTLWQRVVNLFK